MSALEDDRFSRIDYDMGGNVIKTGTSRFPRPLLIEASHRVINPYVITKAVIGDPATDDIVAWIVWESATNRPVPYIAVFKKNKETK